MGAAGPQESIWKFVNPQMDTFKKEDVQACLNTSRVLENYKALSCSISKHHFGYQHRQNSDVLVCSPRCLSLALKKLRGSSRASLDSEDSDRPCERSRSADQCIHGGEVDVNNFSDEIPYLLPPPESPSSKESNCEERVSSCTRNRSCCGSHYSSAEPDIQVILEKALEKKIKEDSLLGEDRGFSEGCSYSPKGSVSKNSPQDGKSNLVGKPESEAVTNQEDEFKNANSIHNSVECEKNCLTKQFISEEGNSGIQKTWKVQDLHLSPSLENLKECTISYAWSPLKFTIQAMDDLDPLLKLQEQIVKYCEKGPRVTRTPDVDEIVFAPYDNSFYRAKVEQISRDKEEILIHFLDFGDMCNVKITDCFEPCDRVMETFPIYGVVFKCLIPLDSDAVKEDSEITKLLQAAMDGKVYMRTEEKTGLEWAGVLMLEDLQQWNMILMNHLSPVLSESEGAEVADDNTSLIEMPSEKLPADKNRSSSEGCEELEMKEEVGGETIQEIKAEDSQTKVVKEPYIAPISAMQLSPNLQDGCKVQVNYVKNYKTLNISAQADDDRLEELTSLIFHYAEEAPSIARIPARMEVVLALYPPDRAYYRAIVNSWKGKYKDNQVNVAFMDYGDTATVDISELREINPEIAAHSIYGLKLFVPSLADNAANIKTSELDALLQTEGEVELTKVNKLTCNGDLRFDGKKWSDLVETEYLAGNY